MFTVFFDANVLVPVSVTDLVLRAAEQGLFLPRWSQKVLDEAMRAIGRSRPNLPPSRIRTRMQAMNARFPEAQVDGYDSLISMIDTPDPNDRHVIAAARFGHADLIVTRNLKDFPPVSVERWGLEAVTPDTFLRDLFDLFPQVMLVILREQAADMQHPPQQVEDVLASLERAGAPGFAQDVRTLSKHSGGNPSVG